MNANVWMQHRENCQTVFQHRVFETSVRLEPLPMASVQTAAGSMPGGTGYVQPFDLTKCIASLGTENEMYLAGINLAWLDFNYSPTNNIPMAWSTVESIKKHFFHKPTGFSEVQLEVPVLAAQLDTKELGEFGKWRHTSPTEILMAWVAAVADCINAGASDDDLKPWHNHMLSVPCLFKLVRVESKIEWRAEQLREDFSAKDALARTTVLRGHPMVRVVPT